ncbi:MAG: addiction module toxin, RelE/StbE family [uncultured bacterium]|nr:MAG: addiction module toxin, RelE/StbE family [uncultured bacterium]OGT15881.1 MAG: toxin Y4kP [Gammaproteobacteria bacterium RIFCSPHIGHO2_02_FULL_38_33]OGT23332.1 MAG: toxin Y4kP [Gammaproteobacteria bacterium RIFCSPHIGHO2_12_38_15]OGT68809.1 MAG: toxin Y4kP [Gammaproteobacteria bacterium RIFCSPLOWO2_02_FULL_38_11]OGT75901.1 MAG: toxin Y4kP [Gammaproteobacteria bacterium RIFCSPLOWO2_12_FULL_38_14]
MIIKWLDDAIYDLRSSRPYIAQDKPSAANHVAKRILHSVNLLLAHSGIGKPGRVPGTRELVVSNTPYIIPYRVRKNSIEILRVLHAAMQWPNEF